MNGGKSITFSGINAGDATLNVTGKNEGSANLIFSNPDSGSNSIKTLNITGSKVTIGSATTISSLSLQAGTDDWGTKYAASLETTDLTITHSTDTQGSYSGTISYQTEQSQNGTKLDGGTLSNATLEVFDEALIAGVSANNATIKYVTKTGNNNADVIAGSSLTMAGDLTLHAARSSGGSHINATIDGEGTLKLRANSDNTLNFWSQKVSSEGNILVNSEEGDSGTIVMQNTANFHNTGDISLSAGTLRIDGSSKLSNTGAINVTGGTLDAWSGSAKIEAGTGEGGTAINVNGGILQIGDTVIERTIYAQKGENESTQTVASISARESQTLDFIQVRIDNAGLSKSAHGAGTTTAKITNAAINIDGAYNLGNVMLVNNDVTVRNGGQLTISSEASTDDATSMSVQSGGALDLSNVTTLNVKGLNLASGSTLIVGDYLSGEPITFTGSLNIEEGVIIDLSAWCRNTEAGPDGLTVFEAWQPLFTYNGSDSDVLTGLEAMDGRYVTIKLADYETQYGTLRYDATTSSILLVPEPTTATLSLLALAARRRRK